MLRHLICVGPVLLVLGCAVQSETELIVERIHPFVDKELSKVETSRFGASRMPLRGPHINFPANAGGDKVKLDKKESEKFRLELYAVGNKTDRFDPSTAKLSFAGVVRGNDSERMRYKFNVPELPPAVRTGLGRDTTVTVGQTTYINRVVTAGEKCISCHRDATPGAPLGSVLYVFKPALKK